MATTFVLVPGSFVTPEEYDKIIPLLEKSGHKVRTIELLSANDGSRQPPAQTSDDIEFIRSGILEILDEQNSNVVIAVHSYAGVPGSAATYGLDLISREGAGKKTAVIGMLFIAAFLPVAGESLRSIMNQHEALQEPYKSGMPGEYLPPIPSEFAAFVFNDLTDASEAARYHGMMVQHSSDSYGGVIEGAGWESIKSVQLIPQNDAIIPVPVQEWMSERAIKQGRAVSRVFLEGAGHCPTVSQPEVIVDQLVKLAS